jgi:hypothetical protein
LQTTYRDVKHNIHVGNLGRRIDEFVQLDASVTVDEVSRFNDELAKYTSLGGQSLTTAARTVLAPEPREEWDRRGGSRQLTSDDQDAVRKLESAIAMMALSEKAKLSNDLVAKRLNTFVYGPIPPKLDPEKRRNFFNSDASMRNFRSKTRTLKTAERNALNEWTTLVISGSLRYKKSEIQPFETAAGGSAVNASQGTNHVTAVYVLWQNSSFLFCLASQRSWRRWQWQPPRRRQQFWCRRRPRRTWKFWCSTRCSGTSS